MVPAGKFWRPRRPMLVGLIACAFLTSVNVPQSSAASTQPEPPARLDYRSVSFSSRVIGCNDLNIPRTGWGFRLNGGIRLTSRDPALYSITWFHGVATTGILRDGRAIVILPHTYGPSPVTGIRVARTAELAGGYSGPLRSPIPTTAPPIIPGYRYIASDSLDSPPYIGLWQRERGQDESLLVSFRPSTDRSLGSYQVIARFPLRLRSVLITDAHHQWAITLTSEAQVGRPIYILHYTLSPGSPSVSLRPDPACPASR